MKLLQQVTEDWQLSDQETAILLGFDDLAIVPELYQGVISLRQRDAKDRLRAVLGIAADLDGLYRETGVIREWLREPRPMLNGATPLDLLAEGSMENVLRVRQYVEFLSGR